MRDLSAETYHERTKHSPRSVREADFSLDFENKPTPFKRYTDLESRPLHPRLRPTQQPALSVVAEAAADPLAGTEQPTPSLDRRTASELCYHSVGVVDGPDPGEEAPRSQRSRVEPPLDDLFLAASCTGKLYHVDLYLVCGDEAGLPAGVYHVDPTTYSLDVLREGDHRGVLAEASGGHAGVADAPLSVVTTSTWWRNAWKYRERTFRHAFWDSGTVLANLLADAHGRDLRAEVVTGFADDAVATLLGVDPAEEAPLELVPVGGSAPVPDAHDVSPIDPATEPLSPDPTEYPAIHAAWRAGALGDGDAVESWRAGRGEGAVGVREPGDGRRFPLDPVGHEGAAKTPFPLAVRRRRSCREYEDAPLSFRKFSTVLDRATRGVPLDVRDPDGPALQFVEPFLVVNGVESLPNGAYHYHVEEGELELLTGGTTREDATGLALEQEWAGDAAVNVYFLADLDAVTDRLGDRGYRVAQLEAAMTGGRLYLGTYAHRGLGGTGLTFYDDEVTEFFEPRASGGTPMFLYAFGRAA